jgi:hypothetical protein
MRDYRQVGIRLNQHENRLVEALAAEKDVSISELVRDLIKEAARRRARQLEADFASTK